ncbi:MAG: 2-dehydropantoate 2-reductase [Betaproteobacteria bacterium]
MRICIFGAGAVGGHIAAKLAVAGHKMSAVARGPNLAALQAGGIALREGGRTFAGRVRASENAAQLGVQDVVFVTTKATALAALAEAAGPLGGANTSFVFVQNGIPWWYAQGLSAGRPKPPDLSRLDPGGVLARAIAPASVIGGVVYSSNNVTVPGKIDNISEGRNMLVVGETDDRQTPRIAALRELLTGAGLYSPSATDIRQSVWDKLLINFGSTLCVPLGEPLSALVENPALRAARERLFAEGRAIARANGVSLEDVPKRPGGAQTSGSSRHKPSMLQDYELGRPMEVEAILTLPCAFARAAGVEAPALEQLAAVTARLAARKGLYSPS